MGTLPGRLGLLRARDVMTKVVITLNESDSIQSAVELLKEHHITGAPVVGDQGRFVGILSLSDLARKTTDAETADTSPDAPLAHGEDTTSWELFEHALPLDEATGVEQVGQRMSRRVTSVTGDAPIVEVARAMCDGHWHRVPVVDPQGSLCGIISTMDILAALVNTADEAD